MKICVNGVVRDMTSEEETDYLKRIAETEQDEPSLSDTERIENLEEALEMILSGVIE